MAMQTFDDAWATSIIESFGEQFNIHIGGENSLGASDFIDDNKTSVGCNSIPEPPPPPTPSKVCGNRNSGLANSCCVSKDVKDTWDKLFKQGNGADVHIVADSGSVVAAHQCILSVASPVMENLLKQAVVTNGYKCIKITGVPENAMRAFIRFLYSACYEEEDMKKYILHLLLLSHSYAVPSLKLFCQQFIEKNWLNQENAIDVLQLAKYCDASRLVMVCLRMVVRDFKSISLTEGWKVMKHCNPSLEQELLELVVEADSRKQERLKKINEKKVYMQLHEAMEALVHICRDGCGTIGPRDKVLKGSHVSCDFQACKGLEMLIRHFSGCKTKVHGGCVHCKRVWQLLKLHSRMCNEPDFCKVPLCRHFKLKMHRETKRDAATWKILANKVMAMKNA